MTTAPGHGGPSRFDTDQDGLHLACGRCPQAAGLKKLRAHGLGGKRERGLRKVRILRARHHQMRFV